MKFIYDEIRNGIFEVLVKEDNSLSYTKLFKKINGNREKKFSSRDFSNTLKEMVGNGEINKKETGKIGTKVFYLLTAQSKFKYQLKILGEGREFETRREIYHLLLYFDLFKRSNLLTKNQLCRLLKKIHISFDDISKTEKEDEKYKRKYNALLRKYRIENVKLLGCQKGIAIGKHLTLNEETEMKKVPRYYMVILGFTVEEFTSYISKLKKRREPKPFTKNIPLIPYIYYTNYTKEEIIESIMLLKEAGFLKLTSPIFNGEMRYIISDGRLLRLFTQVQLINRFNFELIISKILYTERPNEEDKNWLTYFFVEHKSTILIAYAHKLRKAFLNDNQTVSKSKEIKMNTIDLEKQMNFLRVQLIERFDKILNTNPLVKDLIF